MLVYYFENTTSPRHKGGLDGKQVLSVPTNWVRARGSPPFQAGTHWAGSHAAVHDWQRGVPPELGTGGGRPVFQSVSTGVRHYTSDTAATYTALKFRG